MLTSSN